jgi:serine/threonine protein phosphatase PrpC
MMIAPYLSQLQSISPMPLMTPQPTAEADDAAAQTPTQQPLPTLTQTPQSAGEAPAQTTALVSIPPSPDSALGQITGSISISTFVISIVIGAVCATVLSLLIASRLRRRAKAKRFARMRGAFPKGLQLGNAHHMGKRGNQEDSFGVSDLNNQRLVCESGVLAVVADGMGGLADGELVSAAAVGAMMREYPHVSNNWMPQQKLLYLAQRANNAANSITGGTRGRGGSTLVATLVRDGRLWFASVGDSRICLYRAGGMITLTRPHVYETELDLRASCGAISFESAIADGQKSALTSYVGMGELESLDYNPRGIQLLAGDWVLLMTDGVFNALDEEEIAAALYGNAQSAAERIESRVLAKDLAQQDNLTLIAMRIE